MSFLYNILLKLLYPTSLCLLFLGAAAVFRKRKLPRRIFFILAVAVLTVCGNGWLVEGLTRHLEWRYPALKEESRKQKTESRNPKGDEGTKEEKLKAETLKTEEGMADCIVVLSGGILSRIPPRPTIEVADAGDRVLYAAHLFRQGLAPRIICTGNVATGGVAARPAADDMADFLQELGVPRDAIITETKAEDTHQHAQNLHPVFQKLGFKRVLLVTSAMHMPRSVGTFRRFCPGIEFIPAPTDFSVTESIPSPWYHAVTALIPTPSHLVGFSQVSHEYLGMAYYRLKGWM